MPEEPGVLQCIGLQRVRHNLATLNKVTSNKVTNSQMLEIRCVSEDAQKLQTDPYPPMTGHLLQSNDLTTRGGEEAGSDGVKILRGL